ncbi:MAG TPA: hypothetical protein P5026_05890 [Kiritimatiellia bacterium]|nr:hypothetical protein [Kiritimatiellia bacterium]
MIAIVLAAALGTVTPVKNAGRAPESPRLLFKAEFDGTAQATVSAGDGTPAQTVANLPFVPGVKGQAIALVPGVDAVLAYKVKGNLIPDRGVGDSPAVGERAGSQGTVCR